MENNASYQHDDPSVPLGTPCADRLISAVRKGADHARKTADAAMPRIKAAAVEAAYWTAYGATFTVVFPSVLAEHLTPETIKSGLRDGLKAGRAAADEWFQTLSARRAPHQPPLLKGQAAAEPGLA